MTGGWVGSRRKQSLPADWRALRRQVIQRDRGRCQWCERPDGPICGAPGNQVDHIGDRNDHRLEMLRLLCVPHHNARSSRQGNAAKLPRRRPPEDHPALG